MRWLILLTIGLLTQFLHFAEAQTKSVHTEVVTLPQGPVTRIPSPNRHWTLIFECPDYSKERKLWIVGNGSHARRLVKEYERSLAIAWSPDSERFFVNANYGSNGSESYVIEPASLNRTDLGAIIVDNDAKATQFLRAGHSYVNARQWLNSHELVVVLFGHFDEPPPRPIPASFTLEYRVDLSGSARRISQRSIEEPQ